MFLSTKLLVHQFLSKLQASLPNWALIGCLAQRVQPAGPQDAAKEVLKLKDSLKVGAGDSANAEEANSCSGGFRC